MSLAITGGLHKGRKLFSPDKRSAVRPTSGKVRQSLFNILSSRLPDVRFLDLYAGSGAVGLEALSRGAQKVTLVENNHKTFQTLKRNCRMFPPESLCLQRANVTTFCKSAEEEAARFDIIFVDPPFTQRFDHMVEMITPLMYENTWSIIQYPSNLHPVWLNAAQMVKKYGESSLAFLYN